MEHFESAALSIEACHDHFKSPSDCPPLQFLLPQHQPLALRFPLSACLQSVIYLFLQWPEMRFHPLRHTNKHTSSYTKLQFTQIQTLAPSVGLSDALVLFVPFYYCLFLMHCLLWTHKVIHSHNNEFIHFLTHTISQSAP